MTNATRPKTGFTLIELLVVLAVVGLLIALLLPAVQAAREAARRIGCQNNLKQIGVALHAYHASLGTLPPAYATKYLGPQIYGRELGDGWAWGSMVLPWLEQNALHAAINYETPIVDEGNHTVRSTRLAVFLCPSSPDFGATSYHYPKPLPELPADLAPSQYVACAGQGSSGRGEGAFGTNSAIPFHAITDGTAQTLMIGERSRNVADATWVGVHTQSAPTRNGSGSFAQVRGLW